MTTATSCPASTRFSTDMVGGGRVCPSVLMSARRWRRRSVMGMPEGVPSSRAPTNTTPGRLWPGTSLANAQTA